MKYRPITHVAIFIAVLMNFGCSQEDMLEAGKKAGDSVNKSYRDNVIKNWQNKVADTADCEQFKIRFHKAGVRHEGAASGAFAKDMMTIHEEVKRSGCEYKP